MGRDFLQVGVLDAQVALAHARAGASEQEADAREQACPLRFVLDLPQQLFVGLLLIVLMIYRPNGLLGQKRVEVV